jgi:Holliday junction resolvase RusA-like endonuclease
MISLNRKKRIKESLGYCFLNEGVSSKINLEKYIIDKKRRFYVFDIVPMGKPRMTQSDKWKTDPNHPDPKKRKREAVQQYHLWQNKFRLQANKLGYNLGETIEAVFFIPMPNSWSEKKKKLFNGMPCKETPDTDNIIKAICDTLKKNDKSIWYQNCQKRWAYYGSIIIFD